MLSIFKLVVTLMGFSGGSAGLCDCVGSVA